MKPQGLLTSLSSFQTIMSFIIIKNVIENVWPMASKLQKRDLDVYPAHGLIDHTREGIVLMRQQVDQDYKEWFEDAKRLTMLLGTPILAPKVSKSG